MVVKTLKELRKLEIDIEATYHLKFPIGKKKQLIIKGKELFEIVKSIKKEGPN